MPNLVRSMPQVARLLVAGAILVTYLGGMSQLAQAAPSGSTSLTRTSHVASGVEASQSRTRVDPKNPTTGAGEAATAFPLITGGSLLLISLLLFAVGLSTIGGGARTAPPRKRDGELGE